MKKVLSFLICVLLCFGTITVLCVSASETQYILNRESEWEYIELEGAGQYGIYEDGWMIGEDSEEWLVSNAPFGVSNSLTITPMSYNNFSAYLRTTFTVDDADDIAALGMNIIYDENPVVFINGEEVWSASGYMDTAYNAVDLNDFKDVLKDGENYIAVYFENSYGGAVLDLELVVPGTVNEDGSFAYKTVGSFNGDGVETVNPWGGIGAATNIFDGNEKTVWGFPYVQDMNVVVEFYEEFELDHVYVACKDEGSLSGDSAHGTYKIEALVNDEWVMVSDNVVAYAYGYMDESNVYPQDKILTDTIKVTVTSWEQTLIDENIWGGIAELQVFGISQNVEPTPGPDTTVVPEPTPGETIIPDSTVTPSMTANPDTTIIDGVTATPDETAQVTPNASAPSSIETSTQDDEGSDLLVILAVVVVAVIAIAVAVVLVLKKKK